MDIRPAYSAMFALLEERCQGTGNDALYVMPGFMRTEIFEGGMPADAAAWNDWEDCLGRLRGKVTIWK